LMQRMQQEQLKLQVKKLFGFQLQQCIQTVPVDQQLLAKLN